jgi:hypothetical protein
MLQILGATCRHLEHLDIWKSTGVTDSGIAMLLGLEAEKPFKVCSTLRKVCLFQILYRKINLIKRKQLTV